MRNLQVIVIALLATTLSACSWMSSFYIINDTSESIIITYTLLPTDKKAFGYAITDSVVFYGLGEDSNGDIERFKKTGNTLSTGKHIRSLNNHQQVHTLTAPAKSAVTFEYGGLLNFSYGNSEMRDEIFENVVEMKIYRMDTGDSIILTKSMLSDMSRPFGQRNIALVFD